jgi:subtilisin-like proprotein convertase family protein
MKHRATAALAASALVLGSLAALTVTSPAEATGGWHTFPGAGFGAIADGTSGSCPAPGATRVVTFDVSGLPAAQLAGVRVSGLEVTHTFLGDLTATLEAPSGQQQVLFGRTGAAAPANFGDSSNIAGPYTFTDTATPAGGGWWPVAATLDTNGIVPAGDYFATARGEVGAAGGAPVSLTGAFAGVADPNGTWKLRFVDNCQPDTGSVTAARLDLRVATEVCAVEQAGSAFQQAAVAAATTAVGSAQQAAAAAATSLTTQDAAVAAAQKAVQKAKKAKKSKRKKAVARAKAQLAKAVLAQTQARGTKSTADAQVNAATSALTSAQANVTRAQSALTACQQE